MSRTRTDQRRAAVFALYQRDVTGRSLDTVLEREATPFTKALAHATEDHAPELDHYITKHAKGWALERIAPLERAILRAALLEMLHPDAVDGETPIPPEGAIDEAVESAKEFCGAQAPGFVNGILDAVMTDRGVRSGPRPTPADETVPAAEAPAAPANPEPAPPA